jgi:hypothetical protein
LPPRLTKVDELILDQHGSLTAEDECYYLLEYTKGGGYKASATNQLITNLKKGNDKKGLPEYHYKAEAIETAAYNLRNTLNQALVEQATLVPIPPSACKTDPNYDDRMTKVLQALTRGVPDPDIRELIIHRESMTPAHLSGDYRPSVAEILANYTIDEALTEPPPKIIVISTTFLRLDHTSEPQRFYSPHDFLVCALQQYSLRDASLQRRKTLNCENQQGQLDPAQTERFEVPLLQATITP